MRNFRKRVTAILLSIGMCSAMFSAVAFARTDDVNKTATNLDDSYRSEVTLSWMKDSQKQLNIVFVLDGSTSTEQNDLATSAVSLLEELSSFENVAVQAGVIVFGGGDPILSNTGLKNMSDDKRRASLEETLMDTSFYKDYDRRSGSNLQAGVEEANQLLQDTDEDAENVIILLTDGGARMWYDATTQEVYAKCYGGTGLAYFNTNQDFADRYENEETRTFEEVMQEDPAVILQYASTRTQASDNKGTRTDEHLRDDDFYTNLEAATYCRASSIIEASENANIIWIDYPYSSGKYKEYTDSFKQWLAENEYITRYATDGVTEYGQIISSICDQLVPVLYPGSSIVDVIGSGEGYDFAFVDDLSSIDVSVGDTVLTKTAIEGETSAYGFGAYDEESGHYAFELRYYENGTTWNHTQYEECFVLLINTKVTPDRGISVSYKVELTNPQTEEGTYGQYDPDGSHHFEGLYTNNSAELILIDSQGKQLDPIDFPKPTVSYTITKNEVIHMQIEPLTIYVGGDGYQSVIADEEYQISTTSYGLPEPGFTIELPAEMDQQLKAALGLSKDATIDLSDYLSFTYDDGAGTTRTWRLERYDNKEGNLSMVDGRYIYRIIPSEGQDPIRLTFKDEDGNITISDKFQIDLTDLYQVYEMGIYNGNLDSNLVKAVLSIPDNQMICDLQVDSSLLTIRGVVEDENPTTEIITSVPTTPVSNVTAMVSDDTYFYINETQLEVVNSDAVQLLVDSVVEDAQTTLFKHATTEFNELSSDYNVQFQYLDLVDTSNGNVYVTASNPIDLYWPYPEGTDENTEFYIVHYEGLNRNDNGALQENEYEMQLFSVENNTLEKTPNGIHIQVNSFSPFALFWSDAGKVGTGESDPDTGMNSYAMLWACVAVVSFLGAASLTIDKKGDEQDNEMHL